MFIYFSKVYKEYVCIVYRVKMYDENSKRKIYKWVDNNRLKFNEYQKMKQREYYHNNDDLKLKKQRDYKFKKICMTFRNILIP